MAAQYKYLMRVGAGTPSPEGESMIYLGDGVHLRPDGSFYLDSDWD